MKYVSRIFLAFVMLGCASQQFFPKPKVFRSFLVYPFVDPLLLERLGTQDSLREARSFSMLTELGEEIHPIVAERIAFFTRSLFESLGYQYVDSEQQPDFWVAARAILESDGDVLVQVDVWNAEVGQILWSGKMIGKERGIEKASARFWKDPRVVSQFLIAYLVQNYIPECENRTVVEDGLFGLHLRVLSLDGNVYFPTVMRVMPHSLARQAGFRSEDIIVAIDGKPTRNKSWSEIMQMFAEADLPCAVSIWRDVTPPYGRDYIDEEIKDRAIAYGPLYFLPLTLTLQFQSRE